MASLNSFRNIRRGDTVHLSNSYRKGEDEDFEDVTFIATSVFNTNNFGPVISGIPEGEDVDYYFGEHTSYYLHDEWEIEIIAFANTLPTAPYAAWVDSNGEMQVAIRLNADSWKFNGVKMSAAELISLSEGAEYIPLVQMR